MNELIDVMNERRLDALCVTETKRKGSDTNDLPAGMMALWSGVEQSDHASAGVGIVLSSRLASGVKDYGLVDPRLLWVRIKLGVTRVFLVVAYAPVSSSAPGDLEKFWDNVREVLDTVEANERVIVCGDLNGWVGTRRVGYGAVLGPYGDKRVNDAGKLIVDLCVERNLLVSNTLFHHKDIHLYTWRRNDQKSVIDLILVDSRLRKYLMDTRAYRGSTLETDHYLVISRYRGLFRKWRHWRMRVPFGELKRIKSEKLQDLNVRSLYVSQVRNRLTNVNLLDLDVEECWSVLKESMVDVAKDVCGCTKMCKSLKGDAWWDEDVKASIERKKKAWLDYVASLEMDDCMKDMKKEIYRCCKNAAKILVKEKRESVILKGEERLANSFKSNAKLFWREVKKAGSGSSVSRMNRIKSKGGSILANTDDVLKRWSEYFGGMYEYVEGGATEVESENDLTAVEAPDDISMQEVACAIRSMKNGKAAGIDMVTAEMIKHGGVAVWDSFWVLCNKCWRTGRVPEDWKSAVIVPLYKGKGSRLDCTSYRAISLISLASKVYGKIVERRMQAKSEGMLWEAQGGFRSGRGCTDQVFSLRNIVEKHLAVGQKIFCGFVDLEKAFDRVVRKELWDTLPEYGIDGPLLRAVQSVYESCRACVRVDGNISPWFDVSIGVKQGCVLSARLFILFLDKCLQRLKSLNVGLHMGDLVVNCLLYADDAVLLCSTPSELQTLITVMNDDCMEKGLQLNANKTKVMVFERETARTDVRIKIDDVVLEQVNEFVYLGCAFSRDGRYTADVERRVSAGNRVNGVLGKLFQSKILSQGARLALNDFVLTPTLLYGSESWVCQKEHESRINAVEMRALRKICGVTLVDRIRNKEVRMRVGLKESIGVKMRKGMLRWFGHVERMADERLTKQIYNANVEGCRYRGRPRHTYLDQIGRVLSEGGVKSLRNRRVCMKRVMNVEEAREICKDRDIWHSVLSAYPVREVA